MPEATTPRPRLLPAPRAPRRSRWGRRVLALAATVAVALPLTSATAATGAPPAAGAAVTATAAARAATPNPVTPGNFTGYGFDQCLAPSQQAMNAWLKRSPYLAVGIYISGDSRACRSQPNLTPGWVRTQLRRGWRLLPITLGPQASCQPRFPRYSDDFTISPARGNGKYTKARKMGQNSGTTTVADASALGITKGSTLWYDLEGFDHGNTDCRESALAFLSAWTTRVRKLGFVPGVYSSAGSGLKALDDARVQRPGAFDLPDRIWIARWDGRANTSTSYLRGDGWLPGGRMKQYRGGHDESWGGVRINVDNNYLDLGRGSVAARERHCGGVTVSFRSYPILKPRTGSYTPPANRVKALQCLLTEKGLYSGKINGNYHRGLVRSVQAWKAKLGFPASKRWFLRDWMSVHTFGAHPVVKTGSTGPYVSRLQRGLNAAGLGSHVRADGVFDAGTAAALRSYQQAVGVAVSGVADGVTWGRLTHGARTR